MKRHLVNVLFLLLHLSLTLLLPKTGYCVIKFSIPNQTIQIDGTIEIPVTLISNLPEGICAWDLTMQYDPNILQFIKISRDTLTQGYFFLLANEIPPGSIRVAAVASLYKGDPIPTKGTGTLFRVSFSTKRRYPMWRTRSSVDMDFKKASGNPMENALCNPGEIEILPTLTINKVTPAKGEPCKDALITIQGTGFENGAIPVIGPVSPTVFSMNTNTNSGVIKALLHACSLPQGLYYDVIVTNPDGDFGVLKGGYCIEREFVSGMNLFVYPTIPPEGKENSYDLLSYLCEGEEERINSIKGASTNSLFWEKAYCHNGKPQGGQFEIQYLKGYLLYVNSPGFSKAFPGYWYNDSLDEQISDLASRIRAGANPVSIHPPLNERISSDQLVEEISMRTGKEVSLSRFNTDKSKWETTLPFFKRMSGPKFPIENTEAYILHSR